jgi:hypothetical protein
LYNRIQRGFVKKKEKEKKKRKAERKEKIEYIYIESAKCQDTKDGLAMTMN